MRCWLLGARLWLRRRSPQLPPAHHETACESCTEAPAATAELHVAGEASPDQQWLLPRLRGGARSSALEEACRCARNNNLHSRCDCTRPARLYVWLLILHAGFPYPENVALASLLESVVRVNGGVPATIGILDGVARIGLDPEELIRLTESAGQPTTLKLSRRDLSYVCGLRLTGQKFNGGTTIASTMLLAELAGIKIFGTGGLGGVHRGAESSMDISADLTELGRTPVTVISSGCKSFLDIPRTLEYLETEGVGVGTFADGREGKVDFPAFWSRDSGVKSPTTIKDEIEAAAIIRKYLSRFDALSWLTSRRRPTRVANQVWPSLCQSRPYRSSYPQI